MLTPEEVELFTSNLEWSNQAKSTCHQINDLWTLIEPDWPRRPEGCYCNKQARKSFIIEMSSWWSNKGVSYATNSDK
jgi:hypothetical protein